VDSHANCRRGDWTAIAGASGIGPIQLGGWFSVRPKAQALVTHGLYSRIRNPIYLFGALAIAGIFLYMNQPHYLWLFVVLIPLQIYRARQEGKVLEVRFGDEYRKYKSGTWF
jgi:protein-S-isoprenylcysteine O-methyltransferase Ste14